MDFSTIFSAYSKDLILYICCCASRAHHHCRQNFRIGAFACTSAKSFRQLQLCACRANQTHFIEVVSAKYKKQSRRQITVKIYTQINSVLQQFSHNASIKNLNVHWLPTAACHVSHHTQTNTHHRQLFDLPLHKRSTWLCLRSELLLGSFRMFHSNVHNFSRMPKKLNNETCCKELKTSADTRTQ